MFDCKQMYQNETTMKKKKKALFISTFSPNECDKHRQKKNKNKHI